MGRDTVAKMPGYWDVRRCAWVLPERVGGAQPETVTDAAASAPARSLPEPRADTDTITAVTATAATAPGATD